MIGSAREYAEKMGFEIGDGNFCCIASVASWWY
jgi:hypothetical protein